MILVYFADDSEPHVYEDDDEARAAMQSRKVAAAKVVHCFHPIRKPATAKMISALREPIGPGPVYRVLGTSEMREAILAEWPVKGETDG
jgi:hypothetical protein